MAAYAFAALGGGRRRRLPAGLGVYSGRAGAGGGGWGGGAGGEGRGGGGGGGGGERSGVVSPLTFLLYLVRRVHYLSLALQFLIL